MMNDERWMMKDERWMMNDEWWEILWYMIRWNEWCSGQ
jgi:hypothetical protein